MKSKRIKSTPIASRGEFFDRVNEIASLETRKRAIEAQRDAELQAVNLRFDRQLEPIVEQMKGKLALAEAYAETNRGDLLPKDAKSALVALARYGWRTGNRTVKLLSRVTEENAINALKALGLGRYVDTTETIAKARILADCVDDRTLPVHDPKGVAQPLSEVGLRIAQSETFFIEPTSESAETVKPEERAA